MSYTVPLSKTGEIGDFIDVMQFQWRDGKPLSQFMCGFVAALMARAMSQVGKPPVMTPTQAFALADKYYRQYDGSDSVSNTDGMTDGQLYQLLHQLSLHYQATATDIAVVRQWVRCGYPVIIGVAETSVFDLGLMKNPYTSWKPAGNHVILVTGVTAAGNLLVRDSANCENLYDPGSLRPGPRAYKAVGLVLVSATVIVPGVPNWLPRPAGPAPPTTAPEPIIVSPPPPPPLAWSEDDLQIWSLCKPNIHHDTGIAGDWLRGRRQHGLNFGPPLEAEHEVERSGKHYAEQQYSAARASWCHETGICTWWTPAGPVEVPQ